ncbi:MAG TPA: hypothetical protein PLJ38_11915, partial [bacterium]|nr:hypothetical protein [bacterium]
IPVKLFRNYNNGTAQDSITIILTETAVGSEIYRVLGSEPIPKIYYFSDDNSNFLNAFANDTITVMSTTTPDSSYDVTKIGSPQSPTFFFNLNVFNNNNFSGAIADSGLVTPTAELYLEARGDFGNNVVRDTSPFKIKNLRTDEFIIITLRETAGNSGRYQGTFRLRPATNDTLDELGVNLGDYLEITCMDSVQISMPNYPKIIKVVESQLPLRLNNIYFKDKDFNFRITQLGGKTARTEPL